MFIKHTHIYVYIYTCVCYKLLLSRNVPNTVDDVEQNVDLTTVAFCAILHSVCINQFNNDLHIVDSVNFLIV